MAGLLFGKNSVTVGKPHDHSHTLQTGDSVIAVEHARREYEEDIRRHRPREIAEKIFEWFLIIFAVVGFSAFLFSTAASLTKQHGIAVPVSIVAAVVVVFFLNRKRG